MPTAREGMAAGVLNGIIYVVGGEVSTGDVGTLEAYNPCTNSWTTGLPGSPSVQAYSAGGVMNGQFYVVEGLGPDVGTVASYNPSTNSWTSQAIDPTLRQFDAGSVINNVLYLVGGFVPNPFHGVAAPNEGAALVCGLSPTPTMPPASHTPAYTFTLTPTLSPTFTPTHIPNLTPQPPTPTATCVIYSDNFSANTLGNYTFFGGLTIPEAGTAADAGYTITGGTLEEIHGSGLAVLNSSFFNPGLSQYTIQADFEVDVPGSFGLIFDTQSEGFRHRFGWNGSGWVLDDNDTLPGDVNTLGTAAAPVYTPGVVAHLKVIVDDGNIQCYANLNDGAGDQLIFNLPGMGPLSGGSVGIIASASGGGSMAVKISNFTVSSCQTPPPTPTYASTCVSSIYSDNFTTLSLGNYTSWNIPLDVSQQPSTAGYFILNGSLWNNGAEAGVSGDLVLNNALLVSTTSYTLQADFEMDSDPGNQGLFGLLLGVSRAGYTTFQWNDAGTASGGSPDWELETYNPFEGFPVGGFHPFYLGHATAPAYTLGTVAHLKVVVTGNNYHCYVNYNDGAGDRLIFNVTDTEPLTNAAGFNAGLSSTHPMVKINNFVVNGCP